MKFNLTEKDIQLLTKENISVDTSLDYTEDEAFYLLDQVRDIEVKYSQDYGENEKLFFLYGDLADKIQQQIPER